MAAVDDLRQWGMSRPDDVINIATTTGLELAVAAAMLMRESAGGLNLWGHDAVNTGGVYVMGSAVTRETYLRYRELNLPRQGVGPCQLTSGDLQDAADRLGGCWDWRCNATIGFGHMASLIRAYGLSDGMRRYNGSGPWAETYRVEMLQAVTLWRGRLGEGNSTPSAPLAPSPTPRSGAALEDDLMASLPIFLDASRSFQVAAGAEAGGGSAVASAGWVTFGSTFGPTVFTRVAALGADGSVLARWENVTVANNTNLAYRLPDGTRAITAQGTADNAGTRPWVSYWGLR